MKGGPDVTVLPVGAGDAPAVVSGAPVSVAGELLPVVCVPQVKTDSSSAPAITSGIIFLIMAPLLWTT